LFLTACAGVPPSSERVLGFHTDLTLREDGSLKVLEQIRLRSAGEKIKRGIFREFPSSLPDAWGRPHPFAFELLDVTRDGRPAVHQTTHIAGGEQLVIADPEALLPPGEHTYTIAFTTNPQVWTSGAMHKLRWTVIGPEWGFPIDDASATVELPASVPRGSLTVEANTGTPSVQRADVDFHVDGQGRVQLRTLRALGIGEGMKVVLSWPAAAAAAGGTTATEQR
jgi:hypothetical protein